MPATLSTLHQFNLGFSSDGRLCRMVFVDDHAHSVECLADFNEFTQFVSRLCDAATEMAKRQTPDEAIAHEPYPGIPVTSAAFRPDPHMARDLVLALPAGPAN